MSDKKTDPLLAFLIERFKRAAIVTDFGYEDKDDAMQCAGIDALHRAVGGLDAIGPQARLALVPLLDDPNWGIRVFAAGYLVKLIPERALMVLNDIRARCPTSAQMTAFHMVRRHENGELNL